MIDRNYSARSIAHDLTSGSRKRVKTTSQGYMAICPNHADVNPSLSVRETESGRILLHCFATTCTDDRQVYDAVERKLGFEPGTLGGPGDNYEAPVRQDKIKNSQAPIEPIVPVPDDAPPIKRKARSAKLGKPTKIWCYRNENGRPMGYVARYEIPGEDGQPPEKVIWPWTFGIRKGRREWCVRAMPEPRIPYNLDRIASNPDAPILWVEGEKSADAGEILFPGWIPTTSNGGGNAFHLTDYSKFAGRTVIISPDNDAPGMQYAASIAAELTKVKARVLILRFPTAFSVENGTLVRKPYVQREGDDLADHIEHGWTTDLIRQAVAESGVPLTWAIDDWSGEKRPSE